MNLKNKIYLNITAGEMDGQVYRWEDKLKEVNTMGLKEVCVFPEYLKLKERKKMYPELLKSCIKKVPLVHIRDDMEKWELKFFYDNFKTRWFNFHEHSFDDLLRGEWRGFHKHLLLEFNYNNRISKLVDLKKIGGLCIDLSHLWSAKNRNVTEFDRCNEAAKNHKVKCNHLNGYDAKDMHDLHYVSNNSELDYLKEIPKKFFGKIIALEMYNTIEEQLKFKKYIVKIMKNN